MKMQDIYNIIAIQIIAVCVVVGIVYVFRYDIAHFILAEALQEDQNVPKQEVLVKSTEERIIDVIAQVNPAVVSVIVTKDVPVYERVYRDFNPFGGIFGGFRMPEVQKKGTEEREIGEGSGFVVSADGLIVTNRHVVDDEEARYSVVMTDGTVHDVEVVDRDEVLDIAILQFTNVPDDLTYVTFGNSEGLQLGQTVISIGNALAEFNNTV